MHDRRSQAADGAPCSASSHVLPWLRTNPRWDPPGVDPKYPLPTIGCRHESSASQSTTPDMQCLRYNTDNVLGIKSPWIVLRLPFLLVAVLQKLCVRTTSHGCEILRKLCRPVPLTSQLNGWQRLTSADRCNPLHIQGTCCVIRSNWSESWKSGRKASCPR